ncbi:MAG: hypothetical protein ACREV0_08340 [Burkholderiales bacterium]
MEIVRLVNLPRLAWLALIVSVAAFAWCASQWYRAHQINSLIAQAALSKLESLPQVPEARYAAGWLHERAGNFKEAVKRYAEAESAKSAKLAGRAKFALGNVYLRVALDEATGAAAHVLKLAQFDLAREAYRGALRLEPDLTEARYNLELLERSSPQRRLQGWSRTADVVGLRRIDQLGWLGMKEGDFIRGLP